MSTALLILTLNEVDGFKEIMPHVKREWVDELIVIDGGRLKKQRKWGLRYSCKKIKVMGQLLR